MKLFLHIYSLLLILTLMACSQQTKKVVTPWGTTLSEDSIPSSGGFTLSDIVNNGELIMLTLSGPESYYDYHGRGMGTQYLLCEKFAQQIGVSLRVEVCKDTLELLNRLKNGDGDVVAYLLPRKYKGVLFCGVSDDSLKVQWAVQAKNKELADTLNRWFHPKMIAEVKQEQTFLLSIGSVKRHVYSPMLNSTKGVISKYDHHFQEYAPIARWDWRLMAAQCYQESTFDPQARSWVGACGLMQIMPSTAKRLDLPMSMIWDPESNIAAAAKYIKQLDDKFADVQNPMERIYYVLACYNGGYYHIRDAMALAHKYGGNPYSWGSVSNYVLKLSDPQFYRDPIVKYGYMRGQETVDYVYRIRDRWAQYRGVARPGKMGISGGLEPQRAKRKYRFHI